MDRFQFVCRVCLSQVHSANSEMRSLADPQTRELLFDCTSVWAGEDQYPQQLCAGCWNQCRTWSVFQTMARESDRLLKIEHGQQDTVMAEGDIEILRGEMLIGDVVVVKEEVMAEQEVVLVKGEPLDYLEGFSLAPENGEDEVAVPPNVEAENPLNDQEKTSTKEGPSGSSPTIEKTTRDVPTQTTMTFYDGIKYMEQTQLLFRRMMGPLAAKINRVEAVVNPKRSVLKFPLFSVDEDELKDLKRLFQKHILSSDEQKTAMFKRWFAVSFFDGIRNTDDCLELPAIKALMDTWGMDKSKGILLVNRLRSASRTRKAREKKRKLNVDQSPLVNVD